LDSKEICCYKQIKECQANKSFVAILSCRHWVDFNFLNTDQDFLIFFKKEQAKYLNKIFKWQDNSSEFFLMIEYFSNVPIFLHVIQNIVLRILSDLQ
jgi:hypothetical protein